jgi:hypothetical protein
MNLCKSKKEHWECRGLAPSPNPWHRTGTGPSCSPCIVHGEGEPHQLSGSCARDEGRPGASCNGPPRCASASASWRWPHGVGDACSPSPARAASAAFRHRTARRGEEPRFPLGIQRGFATGAAPPTRSRQRAGFGLEHRLLLTALVGRSGDQASLRFCPVAPFSPALNTRKGVMTAIDVFYLYRRHPAYFQSIGASSL